MEPILQIIKYLFKKKNIDNNDESIASFFNNGQSFPDLISLIFDIDIIPGIKKNPTSLFQRKINNNTALQFLFQKNAKIKSINPSIENEKDQIDLLRLLLTMQCFTSSASVILDKSNAIVTKFGIQIMKKDDLLTLKFLSLLLNILTEGVFPLSENLPDIMQNCSKYNIKCPVFINDDSMKGQNSFIFLIQIQIIFEVYSDKIEQIMKDENTIKQIQKDDQPEENASIKDVSNVPSQDQTNDNQNNQNDNKPSKQSLPFQNKLKAFENAEKQSDAKPQNNTFNNNLNENQNQTNDDKIKRKSSSFQDKLNIFDSKEQNAENNQIEKPLSETNASMNSSSKSETEQNDQNQNISPKPRKISSAFQDKLKAFSNTENQTDSKSLNDVSNKNENQNQTNNDKVKRMSSSFQDILNNFSNNEQNSENTKTEKSVSLSNDSMNSSSKSEEEQNDQNQNLTPKLRKLSSAFQDKLNAFNNAENQSDSKSQNDVLNKNENQTNDDKIKRLSSSFQDKLNSFSSNEPNSENNHIKQSSSQSNVSFNSSTKSEIEQNNSPKPRKLSSAFQDKLNAFSKTETENSNLELNKDDQNQKSGNSISVPSFKLRDRLSIYESSNQLIDENSESSVSFETSTNSESQSSETEKATNKKIKRLSLLLKEELKLIDTTDDNQDLSSFSKDKSQENNISERKHSASFKEKLDIFNSESHPVIPPPLDDQSSNIEKLAQANRLPQSYLNQVKYNNIKAVKKPTVQEKEMPDFNIIQKLIKSSKEMPKIERPTPKPNVFKKSKEISKFWNPPNNNVAYVNGVLCDKSKLTADQNSKSTAATAASTSTTPENKNLHSTKSRDSFRIYNNVSQIFKYDEENYYWYFCELNFEQLFNRSNSNKITPLVLFIDSNEEIINQIDQSLKKNKFNFDSEESISVFAFQKKQTNTKSTDEDIAQEEEPYFLYVYVPKSKQNNPQIGTILYQIYTFLYMICNLNIIILEKGHKMEQILFMKNIIKISQLYSDNDTNIFKKESGILFLYLTNKNKDTMKAKAEAKIKPHIAYYEIECLKDHSEFVDYFDNVPLKGCRSLCEVMDSILFADSFFSQISGLYLELRTKDNIYQKLLEVLSHMIGLVDGDTIDAKIAKISEEAKAFYPINDNKFAAYIDMIIANMKVENGQDIPNTILEMIKIESQNHLAYLMEKINEKKFLTAIQMNIIERSHKNYLQNQFFNIIREVSGNNFIEIYYEKNIGILNEQIKEDRVELKKCFNRFIVNLKKKETVIEQKYEESAKKGTNYVMREVQKTREIEVIVADDGDIDTLIEPDF